MKNLVICFMMAFVGSVIVLSGIVFVWFGLSIFRDRYIDLADIPVFFLLTLLLIGGVLGIRALAISHGKSAWSVWPTVLITTLLGAGMILTILFILFVILYLANASLWRDTWAPRKERLARTAMLTDPFSTVHHLCDKLILLLVAANWLVGSLTDKI
jgi:hypothetical protein